MVTIAALSAALSARADTITVDRADDVTPVPSACTSAPQDCTLRGAIQVANDTPGTEIALPAGTYTLAGSPAFLDVTGAVMLTGAGAKTTTIDANFVDRVFVVRGGATLSMADVTLVNGNVTGPSATGADGGGIKNFGTTSLIDCVVRDNVTVGQGGGISNATAATLILTRASILHNTSRLEGGGVWNNTGMVIARDTTFDANESTDEPGGGLSSYSSATTTLTGCTLSNNKTGTLGGGLFNDDFGTTTLTNCTVSGNVSKGSGGGIDVTGGTVTLNDVTVANNIGATDGGSGGGISTYVGGVVARNSIVAGNHDATAPDCAGTIISQGYVLLETTTGCKLSGSSKNVTGQDPQLDLLADNGGPTQTHALPAGSPAVDAGDPGTPGTGGSTCDGSDQRGTARPQPADGRCDIGAFELIPSLTTTTSSSTSTTSMPSTSTTLPATPEVCDDCIDNDGNGLTDLEDPACCPPAQLVALGLRATRLTPGTSGAKLKLGGKFTTLTLTAGAASTQDVFVQLRESDKPDFLCARIPAGNLVRRGGRETFKDPTHAVPSAHGVDRLVLRQKKDGSGTLKVGGRSVSLALPPAGTLRVTVGLRDPATAEAANRCATVAVPFKAGKKGALRYP